MTVTLTENVESGKKGVMYAIKDDKVEVVSEYHFPVLLLKMGGKTFPAHESKTNYQQIKTTK